MTDWQPIESARVPKEPTEAMRKAGAEDYAMADERLDTAEDIAASIYRTMIRVALASPSPAPGDTAMTITDEMVEALRVALKEPYFAWDLDAEHLRSALGTVAPLIRAADAERIKELEGLLKEVRAAGFARFQPFTTRAHMAEMDLHARIEDALARSKTDE